MWTFDFNYLLRHWRSGYINYCYTTVKCHQVKQCPTCLHDNWNTKFLKSICLLDSCINNPSFISKFFMVKIIASILEILEANVWLSNCKSKWILYLQNKPRSSSPWKLESRYKMLIHFFTSGQASPLCFTSLSRSIPDALSRNYNFYVSEKSKIYWYLMLLPIFCFPSVLFFVHLRLDSSIITAW